MKWSLKETTMLWAFDHLTSFTFGVIEWKANARPQGWKLWEKCIMALATPSLLYLTGSGRASEPVIGRSLGQHTRGD